jgi:ATP-dependent Clp protease ATP-binding subunit ClpX
MTARNAYCSFCRKSYRDVGPLVEGPGDVYICGECIELCQSIIDQEKRRRDCATRPESSTVQPQALRVHLDRLIGGQDEAKETLALATATRAEGTGRVLLLGPDRSSKVLLARALAHTLAVPFAAGDVADIGPSGPGERPTVPLLYNLLLAGDFDVETAQRGVVYVDGMDRPEAQEALLRLWQGQVANVGGLTLDLRGILFICGGTFAGLEDAIARLGRHPEQRVTADTLLATGARPEWVWQLRAIARTAPLDEETLTRMAAWADFHRADS